MYIITDKNDVIIKISETIGYQSNGNPLVDNDTLAISSILVGAVSEDIEIPAGVGEYTHCYKDGEFSENPDYVAPESEMSASALMEALRELGILNPEEEVVEL